jgi:hypothetical protein
MEVGSSGGPDKNQLSNTIADNLWASRSVSTIVSSQLVSSTQSKEFVALQQHTTHLIEKYKQLSTNYEERMTHIIEKYEQLPTNYEQFRQMAMNITSQKDDTCVPPYWS